MSPCFDEIVISAGHVLQMVIHAMTDHPIGHKNVVSENRWSLVTGSITLNVGPFARNVQMRSFRTGGLSWQRSLKTDFDMFLAIKI